MWSKDLYGFVGKKQELCYTDRPMMKYFVVAEKLVIQIFLNGIENVHQ